MKKVKLFRVTFFFYGEDAVAFRAPGSHALRVTQKGVQGCKYTFNLNHYVFDNLYVSRGADGRP